MSSFCCFAIECHRLLRHFLLIAAAIAAMAQPVLAADPQTSSGRRQPDAVFVGTVVDGLPRRRIEFMPPGRETAAGSVAPRQLDFRESRQALEQRETYRALKIRAGTGGFGLGESRGEVGWERQLPHRDAAGSVEQPNAAELHVGRAIPGVGSVGPNIRPGLRDLPAGDRSGDARSVGAAVSAQKEQPRLRAPDQLLPQKVRPRSPSGPRRSWRMCKITRPCRNSWSSGRKIPANRLRPRKPPKATR